MLPLIPRLSAAALEHDEQPIGSLIANDWGMLTITVGENATEQRWILDGLLTDYSVAEVLSNWFVSKDRQTAGYRVVDLDGLSVIDSSGERALSMMIHDGAKFGGLYARRLLRALQMRGGNTDNVD
jgi:hypothetical protein